MNTCPNCSMRVLEKSQWFSSNGTLSNHEYICGCGCHWVDRYDFWRRDVIYHGTTTNTDRPTSIDKND